MSKEIGGNNEELYIHKDEVKRIVTEVKKESIKIGIKKVKQDYIKYLYLLPGFAEKEENEDSRAVVCETLIFARNVLLTKVFMMTRQQIEQENKKYFNKVSLEKCCECFKIKEKQCRRQCPIDCPEYKKPCGFQEN